jgi:hypothetical protein
VKITIRTDGLFFPGILELAYGRMGGDIRDVISIGKLVRKSDGPQEIELIMKTRSMELMSTKNS